MSTVSSGSGSSAVTPPAKADVTSFRSLTKIGRLLPHSIRGILLLLLVTAMAPIVLSEGIHYRTVFMERRTHELQHNLELARSVALTFDAYVRDILREEMILGVALTALYSQSNDVQSNDLANRLLSAALAEYPPARKFRWIDVRGKGVSSTQSEDVGWDFSDRLHFREIIAGREWIVSDLYPGLMDESFTFCISRGIRGSDGALQGIVETTIDPARLGEILKVERAEHGYVLIMDRQGQVVYRYPEVDLLSARYDEGPVQTIIARVLQGEEVTGIIEPREEGKVIAGFVPISSVGWVAMAGRPEAHVLEPVVQELWRDVSREVILIVIAVVLVLFASRSITGPILRLRNHALAVGRGELIRSVEVDGPGELADLARAFNRMSQEIQAREAQVEHAYRDAQEAIRVRDEFLAVAAHELKTPITSLRGYAQLLVRQFDKHGLTDPRHVRHALSVIDQQSRKLSRLVFQLFEVSDIAAGGLALNREVTDIISLVESVIEVATASSPGHTFAVKAPHSLPASVDSARFHLVVATLVDNVIKQSPNGGHIDVEASTEEGMVHLVVSETGSIISSERQAKILDHLSAPRLDRYSAGMDLDLYVSRHLVDMHDGKITVELPQGGGIRFVVSIPTGIRANQV